MSRRRTCVAGALRRLPRTRRPSRPGSGRTNGIPQTSKRPEMRSILVPGRRRTCSTWAVKGVASTSDDSPSGAASTK